MSLSRSHDPSHEFNGLIWVDVGHFLFFKILSFNIGLIENCVFKFVLIFFYEIILVS